MKHDEYTMIPISKETKKELKFICLQENTTYEGLIKRFIRKYAEELL